MLNMDDFARDNWEAVTWRIVSGTYVKGFVLSECLPPPMYFDWLVTHMKLHDSGSIRVENANDASGLLVWKLSLRQKELKAPAS